MSCKIAPGIITTTLREAESEALVRAGVYVGRPERVITPDVDSGWSEAERKAFAADMVQALGQFLSN